MIITDRFVFVHLPKTGGTFVESVLTRIHRARGDRVQEWRLERSPRSWLRGLLSKVARPLLRKRNANTVYVVRHRKEGLYSPHGTVAQIPPEHRDKPVLGVLRNPYDWYVSNFEFKWWIQNPPPPAQRDRMKADCPAFPDLSFEDYVRLSNRPRRAGGGPGSPDERPGYYTGKVVKFYFIRPPAPGIGEAYLREERFRQDLHPRFRPIFQDDLNRQLHDFLLEQGYPAGEIAFILKEGRILPPGSARPADKNGNSITRRR